MASSSSARNTVLVEVGNARCEADVGNACEEAARGSSSELTRSTSIGERFSRRSPSRTGRSISELKTFTGYPYEGRTLLPLLAREAFMAALFALLARRRRNQHRFLSLDSVAPEGFGPIEGRVGALQPIAYGSSRKLRNPDADREACPRFAGCMAYAELLDLVPYPIHAGLRVRERLLRKNNE